MFYDQSIRYYRKLWDDFRVGVDPRTSTLAFHVHVVPSTYPFFCILSDLGFKRHQIYILGKNYSTVPEISYRLKEQGFKICSSHGSHTAGKYEEHLYRQVPDFLTDVFERNHGCRYLLVDSGGVLAQGAKAISEIIREREVIGVEMTTQGTYFSYPYPTVEVALSQAKKEIESPFIGSSVLDEVKSRGLLEEYKKYGVIGCGAIGSALLQQLRDCGKEAYFCDIQNLHENNHSLKKLISNSDVILGCTGRPSVAPSDLAESSGEKVLISASSKDTEFSKLLLFYSPQLEGLDPFGDLDIKTDRGITLKILNGGFPINFNRQMSVKDEFETEIMLTRGLWLAGIAQSICMPNAQEKFGVPLSKNLQMCVVKNWLDFFGSDLRESRRDVAFAFINHVEAISEKQSAESMTRNDIVNRRGDNGRAIYEPK